jgi:hypothetical protein
VPSASPEWLAGARAEAGARDEGLNAGAREARSVLEALARRRPLDSQAQLAADVARICTAGQPFRFRCLLARRILLGR